MTSKLSPFAHETQRMFARSKRPARGRRAWTCRCGETLPARYSECPECGDEREQGTREGLTVDEALRIVRGADAW